MLFCWFDFLDLKAVKELNGKKKKKILGLVVEGIIPESKLNGCVS